MERKELDVLLTHLQDGPFKEAAALVSQSLDAGASFRRSTVLVMSFDLINTYQVRLKRLRQAGIQMPGFKEVAELLSGNPTAGWYFVAVEGEHSGGVVLLSDDGKHIGCFSYSD